MGTEVLAESSHLPQISCIPHTCVMEHHCKGGYTHAPTVKASLARQTVWGVRLRSRLLWWHDHEGTWHLLENTLCLEGTMRELVGLSCHCAYLIQYWCILHDLCTLPGTACLFLLARTPELFLVLAVAAVPAVLLHTPSTHSTAGVSSAL